MGTLPTTSADLRDRYPTVATWHAGIIAAVITFLWVIHVIVFMFFYPPQSLFLNEYFIQVSQPASRQPRLVTKRASATHD